MVKRQTLDGLIIILMPIIIGIVSAFFVPDNDIEISVWQSFLGVVIGALGTLLGFMIAAVSVLLALDNGKYIALIKRTGHYKTILTTYMICCFHLLISLVLTMLFMLSMVCGALFYKILCGALIDVVVIIGICLFFLFEIVNCI